MYDLIIIGAGTAGISAYNQAIKHTQNLLVINAEHWDTTCARVGCMPSKVLIAAANHMHDAQHLQNMGIDAQQQLSPTRVMQHIRQLRDHFTASTLKQVASWPTHHKRHGYARFITSQTVDVNGKPYSAKAFIVATGSTPRIDPAWQQTLGNLLLTTDNVFELNELPHSMAVIGSGVIALELAQAFSRLGVTVDVFARSQRIGALTHPDLQAQAQALFSKALLSQELNIYWQTVPHAVARSDHQAILDFEWQGQAQQKQYDAVLYATGRIPNLAQLGLAHVDATFADVSHLPIDPITAQLGQHPIYVVGDAHSTHPVQHEAARAGKMAARNALKIDALSEPVYTPVALNIVFSEPQQAIVGLSHAQLLQAGVPFVTGVADFTKQGRALVIQKNFGALQVYVDAATGTLLGAELLCSDAEHLAHLLAWAIQDGLNIEQLLQKPFYHPTVTEALRTALKHARRQMQLQN